MWNAARGHLEKEKALEVSADSFYFRGLELTTYAWLTKRERLSPFCCTGDSKTHHWCNQVSTAVFKFGWQYCTPDVFFLVRHHKPHPTQLTQTWNKLLGNASENKSTIISRLNNLIPFNTKLNNQQGSTMSPDRPSAKLPPDSIRSSSSAAGSNESVGSKNQFLSFGTLLLAEIPAIEGPRSSKVLPKDFQPDKW